MKKIILFALLALIVGFLPLKAENCFYPATFDPVLLQVHLNCIDLGVDTCYTAVLEVKPQPDKLYIGLVMVKKSDIPIENIPDLELIPYYDPDNETLVIPVLMVSETPYKISLKLIWTNPISFDLVNVIQVPSVGLPICIDDGNEDNQGGQGNFSVISHRLRYNNEMVLCREYKGSPEFISLAAQTAPDFPATGPGFTSETVYEPCPSGYIMGCYMIDEDNNWYATYKYSHPLADYLVPLDCPEDQGYHYIFP